jgi:hypothetical protein
VAFVNVPKDLSKVKTKLALNLTKRQLICFGIAAATGIPVYLTTRGAIGNTGAALLMIGLMLPPFFLGVYEKDGQPAEIILRNYISAHFFWPGTRPYKTENFFDAIDKEAKNLAPQSQTTAKTAVAKYPAGKGKPQGREKGRATHKP